MRLLFEGVLPENEVKRLCVERAANFSGLLVISYMWLASMKYFMKFHPLPSIGGLLIVFTGCLTVTLMLCMPLCVQCLTGKE